MSVPTSFRHRLRVRYAETDAMGVAHHAAYLPWLEEARIEGLRACGFSYRELEASGVFMPVIEVQVNYRRPLAFDDEIDLVTTLSILGPSRIAFDTRVLSGLQLHAEARVVVAVLDAQGRPRRLPEVVAAGLIAGFQGQ